MFLNVGRLLNLALGGVKRVFVLFQHLLQPLWQGHAQLAGVLEDRAALPFTLEEIVTRTNLEELVTLKVYVRVPFVFSNPLVSAVLKIYGSIERFFYSPN